MKWNEDDAIRESQAPYTQASIQAINRTILKPIRLEPIIEPIYSKWRD